MTGIESAAVWTAVMTAASAIVLLSGAAEKLGGAVRALRSPNARQDARLAQVERHLAEVDGFLAMDKKRLDGIEEGSRATQRALLALLDHGIDGNNIEQMQHAKEALQNHLINR